MKGVVGHAKVSAARESFGSWALTRLACVETTGHVEASAIFVFPHGNVHSAQKRDSVAESPCLVGPVCRQRLESRLETPGPADAGPGGDPL